MAKGNRGYWWRVLCAIAPFFVRCIRCGLCRASAKTSAIWGSDAPIHAAKRHEVEFDQSFVRHRRARW